MAKTAQSVIDFALGEVGYLEKRSNSNLTDKTANAGYNNYTKYGSWYNNGAYQAQPWCDIFVSWCGEQAGASDIIGHFAYCPSHVNWFKNRGQWHRRSGYTPSKGDVIFFDSDGSGDACHVGLVYSVDSNYVYTVEGNASNASGVTPNGGGVCKKAYSLSSTYILGYGHPAYETSSSATAATNTTSNTAVTNPYLYLPTVKAQVYKNGSTPEEVYSDSAFTEKTGSLNPYEICWCFGRVGNSYLVVYNVDDFPGVYKIGFVLYNGETTF